MEKKQNQIRGVLLGMAVGDAMGHAVESRSLEEIRNDYGPNGLLGYDLVNGYADVTSYTQLAAFSANGLLLGLTRGRVQGKMAPLVRYIALAVKEWSRSQHFCTPERNYCWLSTVPEMKRRFCMDTRMLDALTKETLGTLEEPQYLSNHPGPLTEVIPIALLGEDLNLSQDELDRLGAEAVALTHGEPEAFLTGATLTHLLSGLLRKPDCDLEELVRHTMDAITLQFGREYGQTSKIWESLQMALTLASSSHIPPMEAMETLSCRTAPEVLAGAIYTVATCGGDFDAAMITAVNHSGRSGAVGAIAGSMLGAILGQDALPDFYLDGLEPTDTLFELADDLTMGCPMVVGGSLFDHDWDRKYLHAGL